MIDIPKAFICTEQNEREKVNMHFRKRMTKIMCMLAP